MHNLYPRTPKLNVGMKLKDVLAIMQKPVRSVMFELKVMEPGAFKFDYIATVHANYVPNCKEAGAGSILDAVLRVQMLTRH